MNFKIISINAAKKAVLFVKPTVTTSQRATGFTFRLLEQRGIRLLTTIKTFTGPEIDSQRLIQKHYGAHYNNTIKNPNTDIAINSDDKQKFLNAFGLSFEDAISHHLIKSGYGFMAEQNITAAELNNLWVQSTNVKKIAGIRFGTVLHNRQTYIITNGFIP